MSELYVEIGGTPEKAPLALIHGWGMHGGVWQPLVKKLARYFQLYVIDLPGMGFSPAMMPVTLQSLAETLLAALPDEVALCGWSLGGLIAQRMALLQPERVRRLVLVGSTPRFVNTAPTHPVPWQYGMDAEVFRSFALQVSTDYQSTLVKFLTLQCMGARDTRGIVRQLREAFAARPTPTVHTLQGTLDILLEQDLRPEIDRLRQPTLLIHGDRDVLVPLQAAHWMSRQLPDAALRVIAGASHAPFLSHAEQFCAALLQFLEPDPC